MPFNLHEQLCEGKRREGGREKERGREKEGGREKERGRDRGMCANLETEGEGETQGRTLEIKIGRAI